MPRKAVPACVSEKNVFPERLTKAMKERGENQTTLAEKITAQYLTIQRQTISLYMNGQSKPDTERLTAIAKVLNVSADWLLGLSEEKSLNGDISQVCDYTGLSKDAIYTLVSLKDTPSGCMSTIADYILRQEDFFVGLVWYLSTCVWGAIDKTVLGYRSVSNVEQEKYKKEINKGWRLKVTAPPMPTPIFRPDEELDEAVFFAQIIKDIPRLYDSFKAEYGNDSDFIRAVSQNYVEIMLKHDGE